MPVSRFQPSVVLSAPVTRCLLRFLCLLCIAAGGLPTDAAAQDLPVIAYTTKDGLTHDAVHRVVRDARGFLWIGMPTALMRFDGEHFTTYGRADGLDTGTGINGIEEDSGSRLWIATNGGGIFRFDLTSTDREKRFTQFRIGEGRATNRVNAMTIRPDGAIWVGTDAGLFVGGPSRTFRRLTLPTEQSGVPSGIQVAALAVDRTWLWVGTTRGLFRCELADASGCTAGAAVGASTILVDRRRGLWVGGSAGVHKVEVDGAGTVTQLRLIPVGARVRRLIEASDGSILAATEDGRVLAISGDDARPVFASAEGGWFNDIAEDAARNLWVASNVGLFSLRRQGVALYSARHGQRSPYVRALRRDSAGGIYALTEDGWLHRVEGDRLTAVRLLLPPGVRRSSWPGTSIQVDSAGDVWLGTASGLLRYRRPRFSSGEPAEIAPYASYSTADGLTGDHVSELFEDSRGDLWIANIPVAAGSLTVWRRRSGTFETFGAANGLPSFNQLVGFLEDTHGAIWARLREGGVARITGSRTTVFAAESGLSQLVMAGFVDDAGQLWLGGTDALLRVSDTAADRLSVTRVLDRLGSGVRSLAQDRNGNLLVGTYDGLLSLNPASGALRRFSTFEGMPRANIEMLLRGPAGAVFVLAGRTLARLAPQSSEWWDSPPRCLLSGVRVGNATLTLPETGLERAAAFTVPPSQNTIEIEFLGLSPRFGEPLDYEYRLSGVSNEWTRSPQRRVTYMGLAAGSYTFEVRVASANASLSAPASVSFTVLPPWYRSWWFLSLASGAVLLAAYLAHRAQLAQALRTERLRSRIATDLHDDIGSSLSQIAILAEVARRRAGTSGAGVAEPLASIATTSRDLVDAMSDIVWAVNPRTDSLGDLTRRMHRFAEETLGGADIALLFSAPPSEIELKLGADLRRELYLILKESVNNIARHSGATRAVVELTLARSELRLTITDNGRGFDPGAAVDGNGIASMRKRAIAFGGAFDIESAPGAGTRVSLRASLRGAA